MSAQLRTKAQPRVRAFKPAILPACRTEDREHRRAHLFEAQRCFVATAGLYLAACLAAQADPNELAALRFWAEDLHEQRLDLAQEFRQLYGEPLSLWQLRQQIEALSVSISTIRREIDALVAHDDPLLRLCAPSLCSLATLALN